MKINWFSPLPPLRSGIADDTAALLPYLARRSEVTVWTPQTEWQAELEQYARIRRYQPGDIPWHDLNAAEVTVFHLGNHPEFHGPIWEASQRHPGVVVLHDLDVQQLFAGLVARNLGLSPNEYSEMMAFHHGEEGAAAAEAFLSGGCKAEDMPRDFPLTGAAIENATGVIVHTPGGASYVRQLTTSPATYVPLSATPREQKRASRAAGEGVCRLIIFGLLGPNRRIESVLQALRDCPQRDCFRLDIYGMLEAEGSIKELIAEFGLGDRVVLHGFVPDAELDAALTAGDLAINLRNPTMGEASASQLRIWQAGLPSLVTDVDWYATLPDETVARVGRESELPDLQAHFTNLLRDPATYRRIGENGRGYVQQNHTVEKYLDGLFSMLELTTRQPAREAITWMSGRAGSAIRPWFADEAAGVLLPRLTQTISSLFGDRPKSGKPFR